jgi:hypothetical protein
MKQNIDMIDDINVSLKNVLDKNQLSKISKTFFNNNTQLDHFINREIANNNPTVIKFVKIYIKSQLSLNQVNNF